VQIVNPNHRGGILERQRDVSIFLTTTPSTRTHRQNVWEKGRTLVDIWLPSFHARVTVTETEISDHIEAEPDPTGLAEHP